MGVTGGIYFGRRLRHPGVDHSEKQLSPMVEGFRSNGIDFLAHLPAAITVGDAIELERIIPGRATLENGVSLCDYRHPAASWSKPGGQA